MTETAQPTDAYVHWFRHSAPYIHAHRGKTFVVMLPGECLTRPESNNIVADIALLNSFGVNLVLVHGARTQIDDHLEGESEFHRGMRITSKDDMQHILEAVGAVRFRLESIFSSGLPSSPMHGANIRVRGGNFVTAMPQGVIDGVDYQYTGKVRSIDKIGLQQLLSSNSTVLVSPLGYSATGEIFNVNFADVAVQIAIALKADKLIAFNDDGPIRDAEGTIFRELTLLKCERFLLDQRLRNRANTYFSLRACHTACDGGVPRAHVVSSSDDGALLKELFTRDGSGTMVYRDSYETIRRARIEDVQGILGLLSPLESAGILVKRSRELLEREVHHFTVMEKDGVVIGCAALYPFTEPGCGELACVAINKDYQGDGRAAKLLTHIERQAMKLHISELFVLTTQTAHWFLEQGFVETLVDSLPVERKALYNYQRRSKVFVKKLNG